MSSFNPHMPGLAHRPAFGAPMPAPAPHVPAGTLLPGTKIQVGNHKVVIQKYLSEGGFAHVYLVKMPKVIDGTDIAVLKRVAVPDKEALANMRTEVETMKKLKGHRPIVTYFDSHASQLKGGGYEVFLLMEYCNGGGLIDFMNTRLQNRLTEPEILKIFSDVAEGVACMHYLKPPLLHRDLKVENVLITTTATSKRFKLCDFGSTAPPRPAATNVTECRLIEEDIQKHTTLQYRSPEMIDVYRKQPIDEKSDIWALGVLLYKLCYYTTPFEEQGQLAILNASFKYPSYPPFSDNLKVLIASMLKENPRSRPNIYQVLREACLMQGLEVPIKDIYAGRTASEARKNQQLPDVPDIASPPPVVGAVFAPPPPKQEFIPDIVPMRRGRPTTSHQTLAKPSPSPMRGTSSDPFAALDAKSPPAVEDDISARFPSLDQFSLLHEQGSKFEFDGASAKPATSRDLNQRVTEKLADDAFAFSLPPSRDEPISSSRPSAGAMSRAQKIISDSPELQAAMGPPSPPTIQIPALSRPSMVSQGTMTSEPPSPTDYPPSKYNKAAPIYRFPSVTSHHRAASLPRSPDSKDRLAPQDAQPSRSVSASRNTPTPMRPATSRHASSSRPSLEGARPSMEVLEPQAQARPQPTSSRPRPVSTHLESNLDFLREREASATRNVITPVNSNPLSRPNSNEVLTGPGSDSSGDDRNILSNVDFLRTMEESNSARQGHSHHRRVSSNASKHSKRSSMPSMSLSGTKTLLAGKFGDAFKRFENSGSGSGSKDIAGNRTPSPLHDLERKDLTPIAGSEATDGRSDDGFLADREEELNPEQRREMERRRLSAEEKRVADAAAEYRRRLAEREAGGGGGGGARGMGEGTTRAKSIQSKVQSLLDENSGEKEVVRTAEGYGRYTASPQPVPSIPPSSSGNPYLNNKPAVGRKPDLAMQGHSNSLPNAGLSSSSSSQMNTGSMNQMSPPAQVNRTGAARPPTVPKPMHLNSIATGPQPSTKPVPAQKPALLGAGVGGPRRAEARTDMTSREKEDYIADFSKRFPSLSGLGTVEMVEREIEMRGGAERQGGSEEARRRERGERGEYVV